jgi:excinuclease ABC subunit A
MMEKPDVESIEGLSPAISIEQKTTSRNPRSTVGTVTEIYDYLRLLFARDRQAALPELRQADRLADGPADRGRGARASRRDPRSRCWPRSCRGRKGIYKKELGRPLARVRARSASTARCATWPDDIDLDKQKKHTIEIIVDRLVVKPDLKGRVTDSGRDGLDEASGSS